MATLILAVQIAGASPMPMPPPDWSTLRPLPYVRDDNADLSGFVRAEVKAGRCAAATPAAQGWTLTVDLAVLIGATGQTRRIVPRAIACPAVEQYAAGLVSSMMRGQAATADAGGGWYRTSLTFSWPA